MSKLKELKEKLNLKVALIGGVVVVSSSLGTCHFMGEEVEEEKQEEVVPAEEPKPEPEVEAEAEPV